MKNKLFLSLILTLAALMILPAVALTAPKAGGTLRVGESADLNNVDPHRGVSKISGKALSLICEGLVISKLDGSPGPGLAESWELSEGAKIWTFHLVKGAKWHNGREMVADDIKWNFERMLNKETRSPWRGRFAIIESMEIIDSHTIKFNLTRPSIGFPATMYSAASAQVPMCAPESVNADGKISHPIGTGAFEFVEWKQNEYLKVKKNPNYRVKGIPYVDEVIIRFIADETTRLAALQSGELDLVIDLGLFQVEALSKNPPKGVVLNQDVLASMGFIHFNAAKPPFNDARIRQAVAYGINKEEVVQAVWGERAAYGNQPMMPASPYKLNVPDITRDIEKAKQLLKEAGYPNGLDVVLTSSSGYWMYMVAIEVIMEQLKEVGIKIKLETSDWPTYVGKCLKGAFTMGYAGWPLDWDPVFTYLPCFTKGGAYSFLTGRAYENPELTKLLEAADRVVDLEERKNYFAQAVEIITKDVPWIYIGYGPSPMGLRTSVKGLKTHIAGLYISPMNGFQYIWLDK